MTGTVNALAALGLSDDTVRAIRRDNALRLPTMPSNAGNLPSAAMRGYLPHYLSRLMNALNLQLSEVLRPMDLTPQQYRVLQVVWVAKRTLLDQRDLTRRGDRTIGGQSHRRSTGASWLRLKTKAPEQRTGRRGFSYSGRARRV
jgi:hypothetical protein